MKGYFLPAILTAVVFSSCSVAYQSGQTPDDVYYSPQKETVAYVSADRSDDGENYYSPGRYNGNRGTYYNYDDRYLRMKVRNRYMWSDLDQWYSFNRPYYYSPYMSSSWGLYSPWNNYWAWNSFYNPYSYGYGFMGNYYFNRGVGYGYSGTNFGSIKNLNYRKPVRPIVFNQESYRLNNRSNNTNSMYGRYNNRNSNGYNNSNNVGRSVREVFNNNNSNGRNNTGYQPSNNNNNNNNRPVRTYTPSSSSGSSSSGSRSSGSSSSPSRPSRGGGR